MTDPRLEFNKKQNMARYLSVLGHLIRATVSPESLLSLEETEAIRLRSVANDSPMRWREVLRFSEMREPHFSRFIARLARSHPGPVYIWAPLTKTCGLLPAVNLDDIRFDFPLSIAPEGIISFVTSDCANAMLMDFSEEVSGDDSLELEVSGPQWGLVHWSPAAMAEP